MVSRKVRRHAPVLHDRYRGEATVIALSQQYCTDDMIIADNLIV
jgi:hypothetical protein